MSSLPSPSRSSAAIRTRCPNGGLELSEAKRLRQLEDENRKLKQLVADLSLDKQALQDVLSKNLGIISNSAQSSHFRLGGWSTANCWTTSSA